MNDKKLYRSRKDRMISGVCGGIGAFFGIDSVWVRILFVIITVFGHGGGVLLYIILAVIVPSKERIGGPLQDTIKEGAEELGSRARRLANNVREGFARRESKGTMILALLLILVGLWFLLVTLGWTWPGWLGSGLFWAVTLILLGGVMLWRK